ncbi:MAG: serpin family protein [Nanoarchaeota archaeon]|nr:serpin family protein [Nanoarchaeota archaeon]
MDKKVLAGIALLFLVVFVFGCINQPQHNEVIKLNDTGWTQSSVASIAKSNNEFAIDLYLKYASNFNDENVFFSPYSVSSAFAMVYEGADGKTAGEIKDVFHFPENRSELRVSFAHIYNILNSENENYTLKTANALWAQKDYPFSQEYFDTIKNYYGGKVTNVDFINKSEEARRMINSWVESQTNDKIKDLIPPNVLTPDTRLVLTNAIYFKGNWTHPFDKDSTHEETFQSPKGNISVDMMYVKADFNYYENDEVQVLELPYEGENLSMVVFLPKGDLSDFENNLSLEKIENLTQQMSKKEVSVYLPKFKFETKYFMVDDLKEMGMPTAFSANADFTGMSKRGGLFIQNVIHQAYIDVNEEGTEAAAATGIVVGVTGIIEPTIFKADHPFMFVILEENTGEMLFVGRVMSPNYE